MRTAIFFGLFLAAPKINMTDNAANVLGLLFVVFALMDLVDFGLNVYDKLGRK